MCRYCDELPERPEEEEGAVGGAVAPSNSHAPPLWDLAIMSSLGITVEKMPANLTPEQVWEELKVQRRPVIEQPAEDEFHDILREFNEESGDSHASSSNSVPAPEADPVWLQGIHTYDRMWQLNISRNHNLCRLVFLLLFSF